jgi:hypothetical protein
MPHLLSFDALSRRAAQIHRDHRERAPTALDGITRTWPAVGLVATPLQE